MVHHVDLDVRYGPSDWPEWFVSPMLDRTVGSFAKRPSAPSLRLHATDTGRSYEIGSPDIAQFVQGPAAAMLAWLMGRSPGLDLTAETLPELPWLY